MARWTHLDSENLYNVPKWGLGFFQINELGNVEVKPEGPDRPHRPGIDMYELLGQILRRGVSTPILLRFDGIRSVPWQPPGSAPAAGSAPVGASAPARVASAAR